MVHEPEIVWVFPLRTFGILVRRNAYTSIIQIPRKDFDHEVEVENDDYEFWGEHSHDYEQG